jgi:hypothetical protein
MPIEYERCRENLEGLLTWYSSQVNEHNRNEATTRLHLIDRLLFECLGWKQEDCKVEESYDRKYTDYSFFSPWRSLIVEAKREGIYFELPPGYLELEYSLKSLCKDNADISSAVKQAMSYCQTRGTTLGTVCNGHQLICFVASRSDGIPPLEGKAIVFSSLQRMLTDFFILWKYLSKAGIQDKHLEKHLLGSEIYNLPSKLSVSIAPYPGIKGRNILQTDLQIVGELVIEDVARTREIESDFIKDCYCHSGALSQYALVSKSILQDRYAALFDAETAGPTTTPATNKKGIALTHEILAESLSKRPILLLGDVGVGKTIFTRHLIKVAGAEVMKNAIALYIDLGSKAALSSDLRLFFISDVQEQLLRDYNVDIEERNFVRGVYHFEIERFSRGIYADLKETDPEAYRKKEIEFLEDKLKKREAHVKECLTHIYKGRKKQVIMFLDNADQRDEIIQQQAFLIAQEIAANWPVTVFLAIRPQTFHKSKKKGALSGYHPKAFTISPPRVDEVVIKRLNFALKIAKGELELSSLPCDIHIKLQDLEKYLTVLTYSFSENRELMEFIDNVCSGNIRLALEFITTFIGSGHVDTRKILEIEDKKDTGGFPHYLIPLHEFLRAVIYGDNIYYDPLTSSIANLFDISTPDPKEHFLLPILIEYIGRTATSAGMEGFIQTSMIYEFAQSLGFTPTQINSAIGRALQKNLIEAEARLIPEDDESQPNAFRVTTVGIYHIGRLVKRFTYVDAMIVDTPIIDDSIRSNITNVESIDERLSRTIIFANYLDKQWKKMNQKKVVGFNWELVSKELRTDIENIRKRIATGEDRREHHQR